MYTGGAKRKEPLQDRERWERRFRSRALPDVKLELDEFDTVVNDVSLAEQSAAAANDPQESQAAKRAKFARVEKPEDDAATRMCLAITNRLVSDHQRDKSNFEVRSMDQLMAGRIGPQRRLDFHSNFGKMSDLKRTYVHESTPRRPEASSLADSASGKAEITGDTFGVKSVEELIDRLFKDGREFHNMRSEKREEALHGYVKPVDPPQHIAKVLVVTRDPFRPCLNRAVGGLCQSVRDPRLIHPLAGEVGCQAYCTQEEYREITTAQLYGVKIDPESIRQDYCEFCYRFIVAKQILNAMNNNHKVKEEIASRFYQTGTKGSYAVEGMHMPTVKTNTAYPDGVFGHMRAYSTADFRPAMLRFEDGELLETLSVEQYLRMGSPTGYQPGWQEIKYIQNLNCNALLTVPQISPYQMAIPGNGDRLSVEGILRVFCEQRKPECPLPLPHNRAASLFLDLGECLADPGYLDTLRLDCFRHWRPHNSSPPQPVSEHRIYYTLLLKVNALREWTTATESSGISRFMLQKMRIYLTQHHKLMEFIEKNGVYSDNDLLQPVFRSPQTGLPTSALHAFYPHEKQHFRAADYAYSRPSVTLVVRPNPQEICSAYYAAELGPPRQLSALKHRIELEQLDASAEQSLRHAAAQLPQLKQLYQENLDSLDYYIVDLKWVEPYIDWADSSNPEETLFRIQHTVQENYGRQLDFVTSRQARYEYLLHSYAELVFCSFDSTYETVRDWPEQRLAAVVSEFGQFRRCLPDGAERRIAISDAKLNSRPWSQHRVLVAALLRVAVMEELHELEPLRNSEIRYNLRLFSGSHLKLVGKILSDPKNLDTDTELLAGSLSPQNRTGSLYSLYYPSSEREAHEGALPDFINSLFKVDFFAETGMDSYAFNKIFYKLPDRACDTRELSEVLVQHCKNSPTFYNYVCLMLELSLKGNYRHCTVATSFSRKLVLEELFGNSQRVMKLAIHQLIMDNQSMIADALSEALCFMIEFSPALKEMLLELYKDWFSWRVYINMDMMRYCYTQDGNFTRGRQIVYKRIDLKVSRSIYRQKEGDYVVWLALLMKKANEERYKEVAKASRADASLAVVSSELEEERKIDNDTRVLIRLFVRALPDNAVIEVKDLKVIGLTRETLKKMNELYDCFLLQTQPGSRGSDARYAYPEKALFKVLSEIEKSQYAILYHFVTILQNYQSIYSTRIDNYEILRQQAARLTDIVDGLGLEEIPDDLTRFCFTPFCCNSIKTTFPTRVDTEAYGHEEIAYNYAGQFYACSKHKFQPTKGSKSGADFVPEKRGDERIKAKMQRQVEREDQKPNCSDTEVCFYEALGVVVQTGGVKVPRSKKNKKGDGKKADIKKLPCSSWWITPCCGKRYSYDFWCWQDSTYCCGTCQKGNDFALSFQTLICECCLEPIRDNKSYEVLRVFDNDEMQCLRNMLVCKACTGTWRRITSLKVVLKSQLRQAVESETYLAELNGEQANEQQ